MEEEIRFYFKEEEYENLLNKMKNIGKEDYQIIRKKI